MKLKERIIENNEKQNIQLEGKLVEDACCGQGMILEGIQEKENNDIKFTLIWKEVTE